MNRTISKVLTFYVSPYISFFRFRSYILESVKIEINSRYRGSFLGVLWSVLNPTLQAIVIFFVFKEVFKIKSIGNEEYFPYVYSGVLLVHFFTQTLLFTGEQIFVRSGLLMRTKVPLEVFVAITILVNTVNFFFGLVPLLLYLSLAKVSLSWTLLLLPFLILVLWVWLFCMGLFLNRLYVRFLDMRFLLPTLIGLLMYLTPVYYDLSYVLGLSREVIELNPLTMFLSSFRYSLGMSRTLETATILWIALIGIIFVPISATFTRSVRNQIWAIQE